MNTSHQNGLAKLEATRERCKWLFRIRPQSLATPLFKLLCPYERRMIVPVEGLQLYLDPLSHLAGTILSEGTYEASTVALFRDTIRPGDTVLDIGANEGFFSALASQLAGPDGTVIAVEPQSRLQDILKVNLALNALGETHLSQCAVGEASGGTVELSLTPLSSTGASSIVNRYRWSTATELVPIRSVPDIIADYGVDKVDFVKVDVEGFETQVVPSMLPLLADGRIGTLLLDYHASILAGAGVDPAPLHDAIVNTGYSVISREKDGYDGYVLYRHRD